MAGCFRSLRQRSRCFAAAHDWVERFYWQWFTVSPKAAPDLANFFQAWRTMIEFALGSAEWDHNKNWHHQMDSMVYELLGFNSSWSSWINAAGARAHIESMNDLYERAAAKWFSLPKVLSGFVYRAQHEAMSTIAINSIPWIASRSRLQRLRLALWNRRRPYRFS
jgi:hypothetical protein